VLACGERAMLSHRSAAGAWGLRPDGGDRWTITVISAAPRRPHPSIEVLRRPAMRAEEVTTVDGVPITNVPRTLLDLSSLLRAHQLRRAIERAVELEYFDLTSGQAVVNVRAGGREIDATWSGHDLIVEIDSWKHHRDRRAFTTDRAKNRHALLTGRPTARYTGDELELATREVAAELRALLTATRRP
jgi:hypothetical protein